MGLARKTSFSDISSDSFTAVKLEEIYSSVDDIDPYIGGLAEDHVHDSNLGELFYESLKDQYTRIRDGDRFYFENTANQLFTDAEISQIRSVGTFQCIAVQFKYSGRSPGCDFEEYKHRTSPRQSLLPHAKR